MSDLLAELERAEQGSLEIDWQIERFLNPLANRNQTWPMLANVGTVSTKSRGSRQIRPYTRSLEWALTLVPEGWGGQIKWNAGEQGGFVELDFPNPRWSDPDCPPDELNRYGELVSSYDEEHEPKARPLALAVCIAALRAIQALKEKAGA